MIYVFLPAYNEEVALPRLAAKIDDVLKNSAEGYRMIVLDDGSSDRTREVAEALGRRYPLDLIRHPQNQGLGQTMIDGLRHVSQICSPEDAVITLDCDDTHDPKYMPEAVRKMREGFDVVILSRYQQGGGEHGLSPIKSILSRGAGLFLKTFFPIKGVWEYSCGYRVFRGAILQKAWQAFGERFILLPHKGFVVTPEILIKMRMLKARIIEIPFMLEYGQKPGVSKNKPLKTIGGYFHLVWHYAGR